MQLIMPATTSGCSNSLPLLLLRTIAGRYKKLNDLVWVRQKLITTTLIVEGVEMDKKHTLCWVLDCNYTDGSNSDGDLPEH